MVRACSKTLQPVRRPNLGCALLLPVSQSSPRAGTCHPIFDQCALAPMMVPQMGALQMAAPMMVPQMGAPQMAAPMMVPQMGAPQMGTPMMVPQMDAPIIAAPTMVPQIGAPQMGAPMMVPQMGAQMIQAAPKYTIRRLFLWNGWAVNIGAVMEHDNGITGHQA